MAESLSHGKSARELDKTETLIGRFVILTAHKILPWSSLFPVGPSRRNHG